jgi:hypothetical protein
MNTKTALQKSVSIRLKSINLPDSLTTKACIVSINDKGKRSYVGGEYTAGWIEAKTKSWGDFAISIDTIAPKLRPAFKFQKDSLIIDLTKEKQIGVIASDDLSGIKNYRATIDGKWVLCEYETKKNLLFCTFDEQYQAGVHTFNIEVLDDKNNRATYTFLFKKE